VKEKHYTPICAYQEYAGIGFLYVLHSGKNDFNLFLTLNKNRNYQNWQFLGAHTPPSLEKTAVVRLSMTLIEVKKRL
jgi:hypothetical protein